MIPAARGPAHHIREQTLVRITLIVGMILVGIGIGGYTGTGRTSVTALIPAFLGLPMVLIGIAAERAGERGRMHLMHGAVLLGLLGFLGTVASLPKAVRLFSGGAVDRPTAVKLQSATCIISAVYVALCVRSFIQVRRARRAAGQ